MLREKGVEPEIIEYLKTPPSTAELQSILRLLGIAARDLIRTKEPEFRALKLDRPERTEKDLIEAMSRHPVLIQRPIVLHNGRAVVGRPLERILNIL